MLNMDIDDSCSSSPNIRTATRFICAVFGDITLTDASDACEAIRGVSGEDKDIIFGVSYDESLEDVCNVTIIATDFAETSMEKSEKESIRTISEMDDKGTLVL